MDDIEQFFLDVIGLLTGLERTDLWNKSEDEIEVHIAKVSEISNTLTTGQTVYGKRDHRYEKFGERAGKERVRADRFAHRARNGDFPEKYFIGK